LIILDTNVISALMRAQADAETRAWLDGQDASEIWTTSINVFELRAGIEVLPAGGRRRRLDETLMAVLAEDLEGRVLPFDRPAAEAAATVLAQRRRTGRLVEFRDTQIAGIVLASKARLATFNLRHFADLDIELVEPRS
jgi:toxin FitB